MSDGVAILVRAVLFILFISVMYKVFGENEHNRRANEIMNRPTPCSEYLAMDVEPPKNCY